MVNIVTEDLAESMNETASDHAPEVDEFEFAGVTPLDSERVAPARVKESPVNMECTLDQCLAIGRDGVGGASLVIGRVVLFHIDEAMSWETVRNLDQMPSNRRTAKSFRLTGAISSIGRVSIPRIEFRIQKG